MRGPATVLCSLLFATALSAQTPPSDDGVAVGWDISSFANNYGVGVRFDTARFAHGRLQVQVAGHIAWVDGVPVGEVESAWAPYSLVRVGIVRSAPIGRLLRFYGGGGFALILPTHRVSEDAARGGGYGLTGLEIAMPEGTRTRWFVELGGMGSGARADRLEHSPIYANGFTIGWGFRYRL